MVKYKQYIVDRCDGHSYGDNPEGGKPPLPCCWVPPCVKWCPWFLEQNPICPCKAFGHVGCTKAQNDDSTRVRRIVFTIGLLANIIGLGLTVFSCFAVSKDHGILTTASFSEGRVDPVDPTSTVESIEIWIGLRAVAGRNPNSPVQDTVTGFDEFCDLLEEELERYINDEQCGDCEESSQAYVGSVISSTVLYLPSIFTDILRMYPTYDLNCQKFYGAIVAFISIALTMYTLLNYSNACFDGFYQGQVEYFVGNSTPVPDGYTGDAETVLMDFDWYVYTLSSILLETFYLVSGCCVL